MSQHPEADPTQPQLPPASFPPALPGPFPPPPPGGPVAWPPPQPPHAGPPQPPYAGPPVSPYAAPPLPYPGAAPRQSTTARTVLIVLAVVFGIGALLVIVLAGVCFGALQGL